ncbi:MAG: YihY/virulence factor BrkB family protein [Gammaproteobacteria bacterium]
MKKIASLWDLLKATGNSWLDDRAPRMAAALAFYMIFSIAPLLIIVIAIAGLVFGQDDVRTQIAAQISGLVGPSGTATVMAVIDAISKPSSSIIAAIIAILTVLFGASGVFGELQDSLNTIWKVQPKPGRAVIGIIKERFLSFVMILVLGFLLLVSLVISTALTAVGHYLNGMLIGSQYYLQSIDFVLSFLITTLLFAMIYKILPDARVKWSHVWMGAAVTALLFSLGKFLIGLYLGKSTMASAYGAAGSIIIILIWVYYSAQILFFGAELTHCYAARQGRLPGPTENAMPAPVPVPADRVGHAAKIK